MTDMTGKHECRVRDGLFVEPCDGLEGIIDNNMPGFSKAKGVFIQHLTNRVTLKPARTYVGIKSKQHSNGILFNFCPFCGVDISAPFMADQQEDKE